MTEDVKYLEYLVKALVANPDAVKVTRTTDEMGVLMTLDVDPMAGLVILLKPLEFL